MSICVYDSDYFKYNYIIPNIDCAKIITNAHKNHEIAVLTPQFQPTYYTTAYYWKEYDDNDYRQYDWSENCRIGGAAFGTTTKDFVSKEISYTIPNMHIYDNFLKYYSPKPIEQQWLKRVLNLNHIKIKPRINDEVSMSFLEKSIIEPAKNIFFHDYNLEKIDNIFEIINDLTYRTTQGGRLVRRKFVNKFPINVFTIDELQSWAKLPAYTNGLYIKYNNLMSDEEVDWCCNHYQTKMKNIDYCIDLNSKDENDFMINALPKIHKQVLYFKIHNTRISLKYRDNFIITPELQTLISLFNFFLTSYRHIEKVDFTICSAIDSYGKYKAGASNNSFYKELYTKKAQKMWEYFHTNFPEFAYELKQCNSVSLIGGQLKNDWTRNPNTSYIEQQKNF